MPERADVAERAGAAGRAGVAERAEAREGAGAPDAVDAAGERGRGGRSDTPEEGETADKSRTPGEPEGETAAAKDADDADDAKANDAKDADDAKANDAKDADAPAGPGSAEPDRQDAETGGKGPSRAVDQPTAVFQAFQNRPRPRPEADQPTAVFKAVTPGSEPARAKGEPSEAQPAGTDRAEPGRTAPAKAAASDAAPSGTAPAGKGPSKPVPAGAAPPSAESAPTKAAPAKAAPKWAAADTDGDAERTSRFVPLRPGDARGGKPAAGTAAAGRTADSAVPEAPAESSAASVTANVPTPASLTEAERTKQQPMPPLPPLDLLAELTNTPPPPDTLLRTTARRFKIWTPLVLLVLIIFATVQMLRPLPEPTLRLSAEESYTFQGGTLDMPWPGEGQGAVEVEGVGMIGTYGPQEPQPTASVAKAMTAYVILKDRPLKDKDGGPKIEIDKLTEEQASNPDWSVAPVKEGQVYTQGELLQLLMVQSANNVAHLLARWDAGSEEAFLKKMNDAAKELGMKDTVYTDPSGFEKTTVSTPLDQLKLAKAAMQDKVFREIVDLPQITLPQIGQTLHNGNRILLKGGVAGIKTGTSTPAGGNLLWAAYTKVDGKLRRILGVVMGVKSPQQLHLKTKLAIETYSYDLIRKAQDGVVSQTVVAKGQVVGHVDDGLGGRTPVVATEDLKPVGWGGLTVDLELDDGGKALPGSAAEGTVVGSLTVGEGEGRVTVPVALQKDLEEPGIGAKLTRLG